MTGTYPSDHGGRTPPGGRPGRARWRDRRGRCRRPSVISGAAASGLASGAHHRLLRLRSAAPRRRGSDGRAAGGTTSEAAAGHRRLRSPDVDRVGGHRATGDRGGTRPRPGRCDREAERLALRRRRAQHPVGQAEARSAAGVRHRRIPAGIEWSRRAARGLLRRQRVAVRRQGTVGVHAACAPRSVRGDRAASRRPLSIR